MDTATPFLAIFILHFTTQMPDPITRIKVHFYKTMSKFKVATSHLFRYIVLFLSWHNVISCLVSGTKFTWLALRMSA